MTKKRRRTRGRRNHGRGLGAKKLQEYLEERDILDGEAAKALGVTRPAVISWTTAKSFPGLENRKKLAKWTGGVVPEDAWVSPSGKPLSA
jgi:hypothetical protein